MKSSSRLKNLWLRYIKQDARYYLSIILSCIIGSIIAAAFSFSLPELTCKELLLYLEDFFQSLDMSGADAPSLFTAGISLNLKNFFCLLFLSVTVIGTPLIASFAAIKGFMHAFTLFFMLRLYGLKAILFFLVGMLPHYLLLIPCYLIACGVSMKFSVMLLHEPQGIKKAIPRHVARLMALFILSIMAVLLQTYIEPLLLRLISGIYLVG